MLSCQGRRAFQNLFAFHSASALRTRLTQGTPFVVQQCRSKRSKAPTDFYTSSQRKDERLLKKLEAQLANALARQKREEDAAMEHFKRQMGHRKGGKGKEPEQDDNAYFFNSVLTRIDRAQLAMHGIWNFEQLYLAYVEADARIKRPPFPQIEELGEKHRVAYDLYSKIPERVADSTPWGSGPSGRGSI